MHGGISDKINLKRLNTLTRNRCRNETFFFSSFFFDFFFRLDVSIEVPPESKNGGRRLTEDEENEYRQVQGQFETF